MIVMAAIVTIGLGLYNVLNGRSRPLDPLLACHVGAYVFDDGTNTIIVGSYRSPNELKIVWPDGRFEFVQTTESANVFQSAQLRFVHKGCEAATAILTSVGAPERNAKKLPFREQAVDFRSQGVEIAGKLVLPAGAPPKAIVIEVTGSNDTGEVDRTYWQYALPLQGVGIFVFDKPGTGGSDGTVTANFHKRAADAIAAVDAVKRSVDTREMKIGFHGASQGGWVAPLAASQGGVDFVVVSYGLAEGVPAEDRDETEMALIAAGHGPDTLQKARELTVITGKIVRSHWQDGWKELSAWRGRHGEESWTKDVINTSYTGQLLQMPDFVASNLGPWIGPLMDQGVSFEYEPGPVIENLKIPQLWIFGGKDRSAPSASTIRILSELQQETQDLNLVVFPEAGHGIVETTKSGDVEIDRYSAGYHDLVAEWVKSGQLPSVPGAIMHRARGKTN
jgi:dienelactone hydrolase